GVVSESSDSDVYSFIGEAGSEIWLDIDGTDNSFDSVVELINANGQTLALSDNSIAEEAGTLDIVTANGLDSDAARPMRRNLSPAPRGVITIGEALETAESGFVQLAVDGQSGSAVIPVEDFLADPAGQLQAGLRAVFAGAVGDDVTAQLQRRSGRQLDDAGNLIATGDDYVLNVRFNQDRFRGIAIPQVRIDLSAVVFPATLATPPTSVTTEAIDAALLQDPYTTNLRDAGLRVVLPGEAGERNLYHVRVRASNATPTTTDSGITNAADEMLPRFSEGSYRLQLRLREADEFAGTQINFADVRYAATGVTIIGQPFHSPLTGEDYECSTFNDTFQSAQALRGSNSCGPQTFYVLDDGGLVGEVAPFGGIARSFDTGQALTDIAVDWAGVMYGITATEVYTIDPQDGTATLLGTHGIPNANALAIAPDGVIFASGTGDTLYTIDHQTGGSTQFGTIPGGGSRGDLLVTTDRLYVALADPFDATVAVFNFDRDDANFDPNALQLVNAFGLPEDEIEGLASNNSGDVFALREREIWLLDDAQGAVLAGDYTSNPQILGEVAGGASFVPPSGFTPNILASDRLAKSIGGELTANDVDWFRFDVNYENLTNDGTGRFLSTVFDIDYADELARADISLYVYDSNGNLILRGLDSNVADDLPAVGAGTNTEDLSRGSIGGDDPYIGVTELLPGTYFVAVATTASEPLSLNQFTTRLPASPLLRLEPIESLGRIGEDRISNDGGGTASAPEFRLFDGDASVTPFNLSDVVNFGYNGEELILVNPSTGGVSGAVGNLTNVPLIRDIAFRRNGTLYGFTESGGTDASTDYVRISTEDSTRTDLGGHGLETYELATDGAGNIIFDPNTGLPQTIRSDVGFDIEALTIVSDNRGYFVGNRPRLGPGNDYFENILYAYDPETGNADSLVDGDRTTRRITITVQNNDGTFTTQEVDVDIRHEGAGTQVRERGFIRTGTPGNNPNPALPRLNTVPSVEVAPDGTTVQRINDGDSFVVTDGINRFQFDMDGGPIFAIGYDANTSMRISDGETFSVTTVAGTSTFEFNTGPTIEVGGTANDPVDVVDGDAITLTDEAGNAVTFEFNDDDLPSSNNVISIDLQDQFNLALSRTELAASLVDAINNSVLQIDASQNGPNSARIQLVGDSTTVPPSVTGTTINITGDHTVSSANIAGEIRIEENVTQQQFLRAVADAISSTDANAIVSGNRLSIPNATAVDFGVLETNGVVTPQADLPVDPTATAVPFVITDSAEDIAQRIVLAINSANLPGITASASGRTVVLTNANFESQTAAPFSVVGIPPGGTITGLAELNGTLFAVSDAGGLYAIPNPTGHSEDAINGIGVYIDSA
ncbi:MAG: hypothetical protein AAFN70_01000, partial [Planctomycetota bacterium]